MLHKISENLNTKKNLNLVLFISEHTVNSDFLNILLNSETFIISTPEY
jgi:hypothetical protein